MHSGTLGVIDALGALAILSQAHRSPQPYRAALYAFGLYAAFGAYAHFTDRLTLVYR